MRLLIVDDEQTLVQQLQAAFAGERYLVETAFDGEEALDILAVSAVDLIILDVMLPRLDGLAVLRAIRKNGLGTPVLMLTAKGDLEDKITGLDLGADDYLAKPFSFSELQARIYALLRRAGGESEVPTLRLEDVELDLFGHRVTRAGKKLDLTALEFKLLEYLLRNKGRIVSRTTILEHVWEYGFDPQTNVVEAQV